jgi:hypothetical protein
MQYGISSLIRRSHRVDNWASDFNRLITPLVRAIEMKFAMDDLANLSVHRLPHLATTITTTITTAHNIPRPSSPRMSQSISRRAILDRSRIRAL